MKQENFTIEDLKSNYNNRHGFVIKSAKGTYTESQIQNVCNVMISQGITTITPEFYCISGDILLVVYPEDCSFMSGEAFQKGNRIGEATGLWKFDSLSAFLRQN